MKVQTGILLAMKALAFATEIIENLGKEDVDDDTLDRLDAERSRVVNAFNNLRPVAVDETQREKVEAARVPEE